MERKKEIDKDVEETETKQRKRKSVISKLGVIGDLIKGDNEDKIVKLGGKCHSAKSKVIGEQESANKRAHSAASYKEHCDNLLRVNDQTTRVEKDRQFKSIEQTIMQDDASGNEKENESEKDIGANLKDEFKADEIPGHKSNAKRGYKNETPEQSAVNDIPKIVVEGSDGSRKILLEGVRSNVDVKEKTDNVTEIGKLPMKPGAFRKRGLSVFQAPTVRSIPDNSSEIDETEDAISDVPVRPPVFRKRGMSMFVGTMDKNEKSDNAEDPENIPKGRRQSAVMQSILAFRRNVLKKKGLLPSESEEESSEEEEEDDSDVVTLVLLLC